MPSPQSTCPALGTRVHSLSKISNIIPSTTSAKINRRTRRARASYELTGIRPTYLQEV